MLLVQVLLRFHLRVLKAESPANCLPSLSLSLCLLPSRTRQLFNHQVDREIVARWPLPVRQVLLWGQALPWPLVEAPVLEHHLHLREQEG